MKVPLIVFILLGLYILICVIRLIYNKIIKNIKKKLDK